MAVNAYNRELAASSYRSHIIVQKDSKLTIVQLHIMMQINQFGVICLYKCMIQKIYRYLILTEVTSKARR